MNEENVNHLSLLSENTLSFKYSLLTVRAKGTRLTLNMLNLGRSMICRYLLRCVGLKCGQKLRGSVRPRSTGTGLRLVAYQ